MHHFARTVIKETFELTLILFKLVVPAIIAIKILDMLGALALINQLLNPLMAPLGLPEAMGAVWMSAMTLNIYTAMILFFEVTQTHTITIAQSTVLATMILMAHSLIIESYVAAKAGIRFFTAAIFRFINAYILGWLLYLGMTQLPYFQQAINLNWVPEPRSDALSDWAVGQLQSLGLIFLIVLALIIVLNLLKVSGIEQWLFKPLAVVLRWLGISDKAANFAMVGLMLGLTYGAGLLIKQAQSGDIDSKDIAASVLLLSLSHAVIEDTLLMLSLNASLWGILVARLLYTLIVIYVMVWAVQRIPPSFKQTLKRIIFNKTRSV